MKNFYLQSICVVVTIFFFQESTGQNLVPLANNVFNLGSAGRNWKTLYVNGIDASGNVTTGGTLGVTGITSLGGLQIKGPTTFIGFGSGVLTTNATGVLSSGPLNAAQIPLLPYLPLGGGTLTGPLNGTTANFTGVLTGSSDAVFGGNLTLGNDATLNGNIKINKDANIIGNTTIGGTIQVTVDGKFGRNILVGGALSLLGVLTGTTANFSSAITGPTPAPGDNSNNLATTAFVTSAISSVAVSSGAWGLFGNSGTVDGTNFIGTTDNVPINFRINNKTAGRIDLSSNTFFGYTSGGTNGASNTAIGNSALYANNGGFNNAAIGTSSLFGNLNGFNNVGVGVNALATNKSGNALTAIGINADVNADGYSNSTAIGNQAMITGSNVIQLGNTAVTKVYAGTGTNATLVAGGLQITGGTLAAGNVLTSDALGNASWQLPGASTSWGLTGNSGTVDGTNFIGTTDAAALSFRVNNIPSGRIDWNVSNANTFFGYGIGQSNGGSYNTGLGYDALISNTSGGANVAIGYIALGRNTLGNGNVGVGTGALQNNITGNSLTAIGISADVNADGYSNSTAIGNGAMISASNVVQLGNSAVTKVYAGTGTNATLVAGGLQVTGGTLAAGNVLTSDALGNASWQLPGASTSWGLTGNSGTIDGTNFIGTTDATALSFKVNNIPSGRIDWNVSNANTFFGYGIGQSNGGSYNTGLGYDALISNTSGGANVAIGYIALGRNTLGNGNVGVGTGALQNNITGNSLTAIGISADVNADGYSNSTAIGNQAMITGSNVIQLGNTVVTKVYAGTGTNATLVAGGLQITGGTLAAGNVLTSDASGNATWQPALAGSGSNSWSLTGNSGTVDGTNFIGTTDNAPLNFRVNNLAAGRIDLSANVFFGNSSGGSNGTHNTAVGDRALTENNGGSFNTAIGPSALFSNLSGLDNVAVGYNALDGNSGGSGNVGVGVSTLQENSTGHNLTALGNSVDVSMDGFSNSTAIGFGANIDASNEVTLGNLSITVIKAEVTGITALSDGRFKKNIQENVPGLDFIKLLKPVTYNYDIKGLNVHRAANRQSPKGPEVIGTIQTNTENENAISQKEKILYTGLVAQDVEVAAKKINYNFSGLYKPQNGKDTYGINYVDFVVPLIKAAQQLSASNDSLQNQISDLQNQLNEIRAQVASLASSGNINKENITTNSVQLSSARLEQNAPNPFNQTTLINYYVPQTAGNATIMVTDINGRNIKTVQLSVMGSGQIALQTSQLMSGTYTYSLYVDGNLIDTKKMILAR